MRNNFFLSIVLTGVLCAAESRAQLLFQPELQQQTAFRNTVVGEETRINIQVTGNQQNDVEQIVLDSLEGECFSVSPRLFRVEGGQRVFVTLTFSPEEVQEYRGRLLIMASDPNGREFVYETELIGEGINPPESDIVVDPATVEIELTNDHPTADFAINVSNTGDAQLEVRTDAPAVEWLTRDIARLLVEAGANRDLPCHIRGIEASGEYETTLILRTNVPDQDVVTIPIRVIADIHNFIDRQVALRAGWNLISLNVDPSDDYRENDRVSMRLVLEPILDRVVVIKSADGRFALPSREYWGLDDWKSGEAYYIRVTAASVLTVTGEPIPPDRPIDLRPGWSYVAYYPNRSIRVDRAFASLVPEVGVNLVKNGRGFFYGLGHHNFAEWDAIPGQGYMVRLHEPMTLRYPAD